MCSWEPYASSSSSARALRHRIGTFCGLRGAQDAKKTRSRALSPGQYHPMGLYTHICTSKCAAGSPTPAAAEEREHFCTELALFAGCGAHKTPKTHRRALSARQSHHVGLNAHICTSRCAAGPPRSPATRLAPTSAIARIKWRWEQGARSRAHRHGAQPRLDVSGSQMPTNVPRVPSRPAHALPSDLLYRLYRCQD